MFSGIVQAVGIVKQKKDYRLMVKADLGPTKLGSSIAINGCCLTLVQSKNNELEFDVGPETWAKTNLGELTAGQAVNVEPALKLGDELGGHFVLGHVDATAEILAFEDWDNDGFKKLRIETPKNLRRCIALKGSIAVDGISLTISSVKKDNFEIMIVPHTLQKTTLGKRRAGQKVNLEIDPLARYAVAALEGRA